MRRINLLRQNAILILLLLRPLCLLRNAGINMQCLTPRIPSPASNHQSPLSYMQKILKLKFLTYSICSLCYDLVLRLRKINKVFWHQGKEENALVSWLQGISVKSPPLQTFLSSDDRKEMVWKKDIIRLRLLFTIEILPSLQWVSSFITMQIIYRHVWAIPSLRKMLR